MANPANARSEMTAENSDSLSHQYKIFCHTFGFFSSPFKGQLAVAFKEWIC